MVVELEHGGARRLAVPIGSATRGTALARLLALRNSPGWIAGETVREWRFEEVIERDGLVYLAGPYVPATSLQEEIQGEPAAALPKLVRLAGALRLLSRGPAGWFPLQSDSLRFTPQQEVLVLPPAVDRELRELRPFEENRETYECLNHPDLSGEALAVFGICSALYRLLTGRFPFWGADAEELHAQARGREVAPPDLLVPGLESEISDIVMEGLRRGRHGSLSLERLARVLESWKDRALVNPPSPELLANARAAAAAREHAAARSFRRRRFWERNWRLVAIIAAAAIVAGAVSASVLRNVLAPRATRGYAPDRVVRTFYESMNSLDHSTMQACVVGSAGRRLIDETMTLYVTSRVTQGYEGRSSIVSAEEWDRAGRPPLAPPLSIFGVTGLSVSQERGPPAPVFIARYDQWNPAPAPPTPAGDEAPPRSEGHAQTDRLWLKQDHGDWVITRIDQLRSEPLAPPAVAPVAKNRAAGGNAPAEGAAGGPTGGRRR